MSSGLSDDEVRVLGHMTNRLSAVAVANATKRAYYDAEQQLKHIGIAIPSEIAARIKPVVGWAGTVIDVLEERLDFQGWAVDGDDDYGLEAIFADNTLDLDAPLAHVDALLYGTSFVRAGRGGEGEPPVVLTMHSPMSSTGVWDTRSRRLQAAFMMVSAKVAYLDVPGSTITLSRDSVESLTWYPVDRDDHGLPLVPVARMVNRPRTGNMEGRSELTRAVRYYCDAAVRTALGMEGNREFYSIPQLTLAGRGLDAFVDAQGNPTSGWRILAGHAIAIDKDEDGDIPKIDQLQVGSPGPFLDQLRGWSQLLSAEAGIPTTYLGLLTDNPSSADAIRAAEARLVKRAERRQTAFGRTWRQVAELALMVRDGQVPADVRQRVSVLWRDPATPTRAATADETTKYVSAGILPADSAVTYQRMGLSRAEQAQIRKDRAASPLGGADLLASALTRQANRGIDTAGS